MGSLASMDLGTHTARLLIAQPTGQGTYLKPLVRKRKTIRLARGIGKKDNFEIPDDALGRAVEAINEFTRIVHDLQGDIVGAVCTGIIRSATNRDSFLKRIYEGTGVRARPISGEEEAEFTAKGVLSAFEKKKLDDLFSKIINIPLSQRYELKGLDRGRADVIPAGTLIVLRIMNYFGASELSVCLSDILEGVLISYLEGVPNEQ